MPPKREEPMKFLSPDEIVEDLYSKMDQESKDFLKNTKEEDLIQFHMFPGMSIRNTYLLWYPENPYTNPNKINVGGPSRDDIWEPDDDLHPDNLSYQIIKNLWKKLNAE